MNYLTIYPINSNDHLHISQYISDIVPSISEIKFGIIFYHIFLQMNYITSTCTLFLLAEDTINCPSGSSGSDGV